MLYRQKTCPICRYGSVGFYICSDSTTLVLLCDECHSVWLDPQEVREDNALDPAAPDFILPGHECSMQPPHARWATREEVHKQGWSNYIVGEGKAMDET